MQNRNVSKATCKLFARVLCDRQLAVAVVFVFVHVMTLEEICRDDTTKFRADSKRYMAGPTKAEKRDVFKKLPNVKTVLPVCDRNSASQR